MKNNNESVYGIAFNCLMNFTYRRYKLLLKSFGFLSEAFFGNYHDLISSGLDSKTVFSFIEKRKKFDIDKVLELMAKENINVCVFSDDNYPAPLKNIYNPPPVIYYKGDLNIDWDLSLSIVGSRKLSCYGEKIISNFIPLLIENNIIITSGLAIGADSLAHKKTLDCGGRTVAILGSGLNSKSIYPYSNRSLADKIVDNGGLIISEFPLNSKPLAENFPKRNRIIAGLSRATLVVEAGIRSGSLITAGHALESGRDVLSVPADIFNEACFGNNDLIKKGAMVVNRVEDIIDIYD